MLLLQGQVVVRRERAQPGPRCLGRQAANLHDQGPQAPRGRAVGKIVGEAGRGEGGRREAPQGGAEEGAGRAEERAGGEEGAQGEGEEGPRGAEAAEALGQGGARCAELGEGREDRPERHIVLLLAYDALRLRARPPPGAEASRCRHLRLRRGGGLQQHHDAHERGAVPGRGEPDSWQLGRCLWRQVDDRPQHGCLQPLVDGGYPPRSLPLPRLGRQGGS
mmetsp:Transcript_26150/g.74865  ORF Transcript_26150/g.74865 Transcript_26150/m.74865 type:complete len:220 (-) Transcript_26150:873-1532(-)